MNTKTLIKLFALLVAVMMCMSAFTACSLAKEAKYQEAFDKLEAGDYEAAYALFTELGDYKDAAKEAAKFHYALVSYVDDFIEEDERITETTTVTYNENNLPATCTSSYPDGLEHVCTFTYNENGKLTKRVCVETDGETSTLECFYDQNGNRIKEIWTYSDGYVYTTESTYDEKGNELTLKAESTDGYYAFYEYTYDENNNLIACEAVDGDETLTFEFSYSEDNLLMTLIKLSDNGDRTTTEYTYDENGNELTSVETKNGTVIYSSEYTYDANGRFLTECYVDYEDGEEVFTSTYKYTYNENGNVTRIENDDSDGYESDCKPVFKLVYVPFEYTEEEWDQLISPLYYW